MTEFELALRTETHELPAEIGNYEEAKAAIQAALTQYSTDIVIDADSIKDAEKTRAHLRKVKDQIETYRKDAKAAYLGRFAKLESQCKELSGLIDAPINAIDARIKGYQNAEEQQKWEILCAYFTSLKPADYLTIDRVVNPKWRNKTMTVDKLKAELKETLDGLDKQYRGLIETYSTELFWIAIDKKWKETLNFSQTLVYAAELQRENSAEQKRAQALQEARTAHEQAQAVNLPPPPQNAGNVPCSANEPILTGAFRCSGTREQIRGLAQYMKSNGIRYEVIN